MNIGIVGLGHMGVTHLQAYTEIPSARVSAVASSDPQKRNGDFSSIVSNLDLVINSVDFSSITTYGRPLDLFTDPTVDAVDLCVPTYLHAPLSIAALQAGKHVIVEKPMALSEDECNAMTQAAKSTGNTLMVAQVLRFWPEYITARNWILENRLGKIYSASFRRHCGCPKWGNWLRNKDMSGGGIFDLLVHDLDYCLYLFGPPTSISAVGTENMESGVDVVQTELQYDGGPFVNISGGWHGLTDFPFSMEFTLLGELGTLYYHSNQTPLTHYKKNGTREIIDVATTNAFRSELEAFLLASKALHLVENCTPQDSALSTHIALAMCSSRNQSGEKILL